MCNAGWKKLPSRNQDLKKKRNQELYNFVMLYIERRRVCVDTSFPANAKEKKAYCRKESASE